MKTNFKIQKLLHSKRVLNVIAVVAFLNILAFIMLNNIHAIIYFIIIGSITYFFSKNMILVLGIPLILVNLLMVIYSTSSNTLFYKEGMENKDEMDSTADVDPLNKNKDSKNTMTKDLKNVAIANKKNKPSPTTNQGLVMTPLDHDSDLRNTMSIDNDKDNDATENESFEVGRSKKNSNGYKIDYASTVEDAYDELNKILGSDGIKRLTSDTQNLMKQQLQLAESMKNMQPLIAGMAPMMSQAKDLLGSLGDSGNMGDLANIAKKFSAGLGGKN
uniref:Uncharacterized protein n=1 Tax=viral metagenome TaxID=1070528 RepID=A0A6C0DJ52_9ZZZZ